MEEERIEVVEDEALEELVAAEEETTSHGSNKNQIVGLGVGLATAAIVGLLLWFGNRKNKKKSEECEEVVVEATCESEVVEDEKISEK